MKNIFEQLTDLLKKDERLVSQDSILMKNLKFTNLAIFIIFLGIALIEVFQKQNWLKVALFLALGVISLWADFRKIRMIIRICYNIFINSNFRQRRISLRLK
ncbi:MAG: hypothetical protein UR62_C0014G0009 [Candidatus Nomurabacteria bacterium GW2011_GWF2_35_12]|uniref:Uncharacterized protein n=3 Tax=Candidatus Nomuraibacteriota TaxID=1752729 RepID=A0A0G0E8U4_9BACT|nr:MAG: hypothetical protein UR62_C0014G0009 [Candidatus Nomurabacteria bacterium GW2011_GWF2_35_12]KKP72668.1 MAG: hypothetical protein UR70_C0005G0009 [Candidatus Nomurabacteria bacterium GW2011_GWB1_35_20]KKP76478.1 MAG: hypothetical protein UR72_C0002G0124 [Parcubacteria group bacterium GW2011_GWC1_35_21]KKP78174.1 MAG: hypothetical protein UR77_C0006G0046 [Candidatus Nomurabacteria bacterium GW2011_GWC2_35_35]KKP88303.1 MAG: hypothetical protein UR92_C0008G0007 [Candidatus Nomurabacteria b